MTSFEISAVQESIDYTIYSMVRLTIKSQSFNINMYIDYYVIELLLIPTYTQYTHTIIHNLFTVQSYDGQVSIQCILYSQKVWLVRDNHTIIIMTICMALAQLASHSKFLPLKFHVINSQLACSNTVMEIYNTSVDVNESVTARVNNGLFTLGDSY